MLYTFHILIAFYIIMSYLFQLPLQFEYCVLLIWIISFSYRTTDSCFMVPFLPLWLHSLVKHHTHYKNWTSSFLFTLLFPLRLLNAIPLQGARWVELPTLLVEYARKQFLFTQYTFSSIDGALYVEKLWHTSARAGSYIIFHYH